FLRAATHRFYPKLHRVAARAAAGAACRRGAARRRGTRVRDQTVTVTELLELPWNELDPRYCAAKVKSPVPKSATENVAVATPLTTCTRAAPMTLPLKMSATVPPGMAVPDAGDRVTVNVVVGGRKLCRTTGPAASRVVVAT